MQPDIHLMLDKHSNGASMLYNACIYLGKPLPPSSKVGDADVMNVECMTVLHNLPDDSHIIRLVQTYVPDEPCVYLPVNMPGCATEWTRTDGRGQNLSVVPLPFLLQALRMDARDFPSREMSVTLAMVQAFQGAQIPNEYLMVASYCWAGSV